MSKILILGGGPDEHIDLQATLEQAGYEVLCAETPKAISTTLSWRPAAIIFDLLDPGLDIAAIVGDLRAGIHSAGRLPIIVLSPNNSVEERIAVLRAGSEECLSKPYSDAELLARLRGILARAVPVAPSPVVSEPAPGQILVFYGVKGGVGNTTVAINTALSLRHLTNARVALIDANFQFGDHRLFLDASLDRPGIDSLTDGELFDADKIQSIMFHDDSGVDVLLAPVSPAAGDLVTAEQVGHILEQLRDRYDYIVVDTNQHLDDRCLKIIDAADQLFVILVAELSSIKNTRLMVDTLGHIDFPLEKLHLVQNRTGAFTGISQANTAATLGRPIDYSIVNDYHSAVSALNSGHPTAKVKADSVLGLAFEAFVRKAILKEQSTTSATAPAKAKKKGFFSAR